MSGNYLIDDRELIEPLFTPPKWEKWEESQHPRVPAGSPQGGEFTSGGENAGPVLSRPSSYYKPHDEHGIDTQRRFKRADGTYTPERRVLHEAILQHFVKGHYDKDGVLHPATPVTRPDSFMLGGGSATGKTRLLDSGVMRVGDNYIEINNDEIKKLLPEFKEGTKGDPLIAAYVHEEASDIAKALTQRAATSNYNLVLDGVGNGSLESLQAKTTLLRSLGQRVIAHYATVDIATAIERADQRAKGSEGRGVIKSAIAGSHIGVSRVFEAAVRAGLYDHATLWDTTGSSLVRVASGRGKSLTIYNQAAWDRFTAKAQDDISRYKAGRVYVDDGANYYDLQGIHPRYAAFRTDRRSPPVSDSGGCRSCGTESPRQTHRPATRVADRAVEKSLKDAIQLAKDLADELRGYGETIAASKLEIAILTGNQRLIEQAIDFARLGEVLERLVKPPLRGSFMEGATAMASMLERTRMRIRFNAMDPQAVQWATTSAGKLITEVTDSQKEMVRDLIKDAEGTGQTYKDVARDLRNFIGLRSDQVRALTRYRGTLLEDNLPPTEIARLVDKYAGQLLRNRTETIARHELLSATHYGQLQTLREGISQGVVNPDRTFRVWTVAHDERLCQICEPMDGQAVPADEPWTLKDSKEAGEQVWIPQEAHVQCRCSWTLETRHENG